MFETKEMKQQGLISYRYDNNKYYMVDFKTSEILSTMDEVAILHNGKVL